MAADETSESRDYELRQQRYFDAEVAQFEKGIIFPRKNRTHLLKIEKIVEKLELSKGYRVLEVGAGTGIHAEYVLSHKNASYTGVDISQKMLDKANKRLERIVPSSKYNLIKAGAEKLPFGDDCFDGVFCCSTLHHTLVPQVAMQEMVRVLKPKKNIVVMEPNFLFPKNFISAIVSDLEKNALLMRNSNLRKWASDLCLDGITLQNFLYTPPIPKFLHPFYDSMDRILIRTPIVKYFSIMLMLTARKTSS